MKLGTPKYEKKTKNYFSFKKDQNTFILRILPPMGNLAEAGKWSMYHRVEFGYEGTDRKMRPFISPRVVDFNTKMVVVESEAHRRREMLNEKLKEAEASGNAAMQEQIQKMLEKYNQDAKHYMNVIDLQGNIGLFKIGARGFDSLKVQIERLRSEGVDPISVDNGRFFVFSRSGRGRDTVYTVAEYKQKMEIEQGGQKLIVDVPLKHVLDDSIINKLSTDAFELDSIYPTVTPEEEHKIVHGGPTGVDEVFKAKEARSNPASNKNNAASNNAASNPVASLAKNLAAQNVAAATAQTTTPAATPAATAPLAASAEKSSLTDMPEDEFFKMMQEGNF
jgi:hypothetical protein